MKQIILEGKKFVDSVTTHEILKDLFNFPSYYGENYNSFWDCITEYAIFCYQNDTQKVIWKDFSVSQKNIGDEADILLQLFQEATEKYGGLVIEVIP